ncbi:hypothetical protein HPB49_006202 [Dermacentor silvarum]|uniref:Uncharacterized protein n=1 Tax=Dermacentor silvarum TaxID=543639 RepID=A0ACB8CDQ7_DERSI|nr:hypothetical protein HPB49_006202 [Dermacentor silvarum]
MLEYSVEGESITPEEFEAGEWTSVLKAQDRFKKSLYGDNAESTPRETQAGSDGRKALGAEQVKRGRAPVRQKRRPFLKMPAKDFKAVCRPKNWDLSVAEPTLSLGLADAGDAGLRGRAWGLWAFVRLKMLEYSVEGESITPEEFEAGEWTSVLKAQDRFKKSLYGDNAESTPRETQAGSDGRKALGAEQVKRGRAPVRQKRRPFLKMPAKDFKVVCRPKNWDLSVVTPRELGSAMRAAAKLTSATAAEEDLVRVNETNNTMTVSTPCIHRSGAYASVKTLKLGGRDLPVSAYVAAMENSVRGVIYNAYDGCPVEEIRAGFLKKNEGMEILDARPLGKSKAIQITFGGKRVPWQVTYWNCLYAVIPYRELVETCYNCRRVGHRADVCYRPQTNLCRRCGKDHPAPPEGESLTCTPDCIVCHGAHNTGSRNCKFRLARKQPPGRQQSSEDKSQDGKEEQRSRPTERSSSGARDGNKSRDRSGSFPPLPGAGAGKAGGQGSSHERSANSANDTTKKVSWPNTGAPNETARERELKRQVQQQGDTIKKMEARMADMERALKGGKGQGVLAPR